MEMLRTVASVRERPLHGQHRSHPLPCEQLLSQRVRELNVLSDFVSGHSFFLPFVLIRNFISAIFTYMYMCM